MTQHDEWLQVPDLAKRIGLSKEAVYRLARAGELPGAVKLGRRYVVNYTVFRAAVRATSPSAGS
jgi:excisionase family DNA binding protein